MLPVRVFLRDSSAVRPRSPSLKHETPENSDYDAVAVALVAAAAAAARVYPQGRRGRLWSEERDRFQANVNVQSMPRI